MPARQCPSCRTPLWPAANLYRRCPECKAPTDLHPYRTADLDPEEARTRLAQAEFERFYERREADRAKRGTPPPEVLGRVEAQEMAKQLRELEALAETS